MRMNRSIIIIYYYHMIWLKLNHLASMEIVTRLTKDIVSHVAEPELAAAELSVVFEDDREEVIRVKGD